MRCSWVDPYEACLPAGIAIARVYFLSALLLGFFVILNLFVSIILESLAEYAEELEEAEEQADDDEEEATDAAGGSGADAAPVATGKEAPQQDAKPVASRDDDDDDDDDDPATLHPLRAFCRSVLRHSATEPVLVLLIAASSIALALDAPTLDPLSDLGKALHVLDYVFTLIFTLEAIFRFNAHDPLHPTKGYLTSAFNLLDLSIVFISILSLCPEMEKFSSARVRAASELPRSSCCWPPLFAQPHAHPLHHFWESHSGCHTPLTHRLVCAAG